MLTNTRFCRLANALLLLCCSFSTAAQADETVPREVRIAVASSFSAVAEELADAFVRAQGYPVQLSSGATGMHYAQIVNGAPFDVWLAADSMRPAALEKAGLSVAGTRATYAIGRLVLWSPRDLRLDDAALAQTLRDHRVAIANPDLAPYGAAAAETLRNLGLWDELAPKLVRGQNVGQTFQFIVTGNAAIGFVAAAQLQGDFATRGSRRDVPQHLYAPIEQQRVLLHDTEAARTFVAFLDSDAARAVIRRYGYDVPAR